MSCRFYNRAKRRGAARGNALMIGGLLAASLSGGKFGMGIGTEARAQALNQPPYLYVEGAGGATGTLDPDAGESTQTATSGAIQATYTDPGNYIGPGEMIGMGSGAAKASMGLLGVQASATNNFGYAQAEFIDAIPVTTTSPGATSVLINLTPALFGAQDIGKTTEITTDLSYSLVYKNAAGVTLGGDSVYFSIYSHPSTSGGYENETASINGGAYNLVTAIPTLSLTVPVGDTLVITGEIDTDASEGSANYLNTAVFGLNTPDPDASLTGTDGVNYLTLTENGSGAAAAPEPGAVVLLLPAVLCGALLSARKRSRTPAL